jgi:hypothetical protein
MQTMLSPVEAGARVLFLTTCFASKMHQEAERFSKESINTMFVAIVMLQLSDENLSL